MSDPVAERRGWRGRIIAVLVSVAIAALFWGHRLALPGFLETFQGFGVSLPSVTEALVSHYGYVWSSLRIALLVQVSLCAYFIGSAEKGARQAFVFTTLANFSIATALWGIIYAPIVALGQMI